ncbi:MAG: hypothetical protein QW589_01050 [Candidatus Bathyarchaeia archaeon]
MDLEILTDEELQGRLKERLINANCNKARQKIIGLDELEAYLEKGYEMHHVLPNKSRC